MLRGVNFILWFLHFEVKHRLCYDSCCCCFCSAAFAPLSGINSPALLLLRQQIRLPLVLVPLACARLSAEVMLFLVSYHCRRSRMYCGLAVQVVRGERRPGMVRSFLDSVQYSTNSILRYERFFGSGYVSTGGSDTTKARLPQDQYRCCPTSGSLLSGQTNLPSKLSHAPYQVQDSRAGST